MVSILLIGCQKISTDDLREEWPVLTGVLRSNVQGESIDFFTLDEEFAGSPKARIASVQVLGAGQNVELVANDFSYALPTDFVLLPDSTYQVVVSDESTKGEIKCEFTMPPAINLISSISNPVQISSPGSVAGLISWSQLDESRYSYIFRLEPLDENPVAIPGDVGYFESRYNGPQLSPQLLLLKSDFAYYGPHRLTVLAIDRGFDALFFYDAADMRGQLKNGPSNVLGAAGFVAGVTGFETEIVILE
ncbi:MAG: hypothetical protein IPP69_06375 [Flavobacteriales bacterium]|nr:hypothetical protein [Flavobacteriales bacterium]